MSAIKINGTWQRVSSIKIKQNGVWNDHTALYARLDGAWHLIDLAAEAQGPAYHVWKAYADDALGNGISLSPEGKKYIGFAVGQRVEEPDLSDPSLYDWSLIKGADGKDVDPEVLAEILEKQDGYNSSLYDVNYGLSTVEQALADADSRLKAADVALSQALQTAQVDFSSSVDSLNESIGEVENDLLNLVSLSGEQGSSITQLENTTDEQAQKIAVLETNDGSTRSRVASLESTSGEQATRLSSLGVWDGESFATIKTLEEADAENASLIRTLEARGEEADSKIASLESTSSSHASRLSTVETRSTNAQNRAAALEETTRTHATRLTNVETKADDTESKVSTLEQTSEGHATRLTNVETKATTGVNKANAAQASADVANESVSEVTNRVSTLEETSEGHASRLTNVETKATTAVSKADAAQSTANSGVSKANAAQTAADNAQDSADSANTKVTVVTNRVSTLEETSEGHASRLTNVETKATSAVTKANNAQSTANEAQSSANEANTKVTAVTNRVTTLEETSEGHASRLNTVETIATSGVNKANAAQAKADSAYSKVTAVTSRVSTLESTSETMATKVDEVSFSRANLVTRGVFGSNLNRGGWTSGSVVSTQAVGIPTLSGRPYVLKLTSRDCYDYNAKFPISVGDKVYISAWVYTTDTNVSFNIGFRQVLDGVEQSSWPTVVRTSDRSGKWVYVEGTYTHTASGYNGLAPFLQLGGSGTMPPVYVSDIVYSRSSHSGALAAVTDESKAYVDQQTGELKAERVIKADANGKVSGVHLLANGSGAEADGKLYFQADEIAIVPPNWNGSSELNKRKFPFYFSEDRNYMYLDEATIQRLSAETIDSGSLAVDGLTLLSDNLSLPAGSVREHMIDPAFSDGIVRVNPDAEVLGGTKSVSSTGIGQGKKITVPALKSGGSAQKMTITVVGPNAANRKDVRFDLEMKVNGAPHNFSSGQSKIRLGSTITYSTEDEGFRIYRTSFNFEDTVTLPAPTKGNTYEYEFVITNMSFSPANTSTYNYADKLQFSISVSEPTVSSGGFITDVRWSEVKEQPSFVALDTSGNSSYPRMFAGNNPASSNIWLRMPSTNGGLLPYSNGNSLLGTSSWRFKEVHGVTLYENGTALSSKYLGKTATATNASKLGGRGYSEGTGANSIASRNSNGDIYARLFRSTYGNQSDISGAIAFRRSTSDNYIRFCSDMGAVRNFVGVYSKSEVYTRTESNSRYMPSSGDAFTSGNVVGSLNGKTSLATNDGYGNSNVTFNHTRGVPVQNGNSARIEVNTDSPSNPSFNFELGAGVTAGQAVQLTTTLNINLTDVRYKGNVLWHAGNIGLASNSWGGVTSKNVHGYIDIGPANTSYAHVYTDRPAFYFNKDLEVNGKRVWHNGNTGDIPKKSVKNTFTTDQVITGTGTIGANYSNASNGWLFIGTGSSGLGLDNNEIACTQELVMSAPSIRTGAAIDAESTLKVHDVTTFQAATVHHGTIYARGITRFAAPNDAKQRVDVRDEDDQGRAHWYGESSSGGTRAFKHAWYDGSAYVNVDVSGQTVKFSGSVKAEGALYADGTALGTNQVVAVFSHPTQNTNVAIVGKNSANGGFRLESHADSAEMRVQTSTTSGGYSISNGDRGTIAAFRRNGDVVINGATHVQGGLKQDGHTILNGSDTWLRTKGDQGIYFSSYGGGWRMTDSTWIRAYGNKMLYITNGSTSSIRTTGGVHADQGFRRENAGSSWISQRDSTNVAVYNATAINNSSYAAVIKQRHTSYTWTVGGLGNAYFGIFSYTNSRTANGTDGYFRMDYRGNCVASGTVAATDLIATSDRRVKDNIKVIPDALDKVCKLTGNTYTRNDLDNKESAGVIAQEVQEVLPEAVTEAEGRLQVAHNGVIGLLVEAVKELKQQLGTALTEIDGLKEANNG
ncbi:tail fiber domain-containing protein [Pseudoalteromonas atlantica]|uniref:tail fiber domain-containing protein n=1 Tax=Pseudoalteromonas atlantica TaxID=288 RepID=UPI003A976EFB